MGPRPPADLRTSAALNALLVLVAAVAGLAGTVDPTAIDHREVRPWGCRTCPIPEPPAVPDPPAEPEL
jgi:hypothetical protein